MELDIRVGAKSLGIPIENPFRLDVDALVGQIEAFLGEHGAAAQGLDLQGLLPKMVKGIAGCEGGCPADAKRLVARGIANFELDYIEGGILQAKATVNGQVVSLKMFPDF